MLAVAALLGLGAFASALPQASVFHEDGFVFARNTIATRQNGNSSVIPVVVGGAQITYMPNIVNAAVGQKIQFQFSQGSHTVTQSTEMETCQPIKQAALATGAQPLHSGHIPFPNPAAPGMVSTFEMTVTSAEPMFIYCSTGPHCQLGQVMVINPTNVSQVVDYAKRSAATPKTVDAAAVAGGTPGQIPLSQAAFIPPPMMQGGAPGGPV